MFTYPKQTVNFSESLSLALTLSLVVVLVPHHFFKSLHLLAAAMKDNCVIFSKTPHFKDVQL